MTSQWHYYYLVLSKVRGLQYYFHDAQLVLLVDDNIIDHPWQLSFKYSNSATELPSDSVAQLVRAWQAICQVVSSSPSLSHCHFLSFSLFLSHWLWFRLTSVRSEACLKNLRVYSCFALATPPPHQLMKLRSNVSFGEFTDSWMCSNVTSCYFSCVWNL